MFLGPSINDGMHLGVGSNICDDKWRRGEVSSKKCDVTSIENIWNKNTEETIIIMNLFVMKRNNGKDGGKI